MDALTFLLSISGQTRTPRMTFTSKCLCLISRTSTMELMLAGTFFFECGGHSSCRWMFWFKQCCVFGQLSIRQGICRWDQKVPERKATPRKTGGSIESFHWSFLYILGCFRQTNQLHPAFVQLDSILCAAVPKRSQDENLQGVRTHQVEEWIWLTFILRKSSLCHQQFQRNKSSQCHSFCIASLNKQRMTHD